MTFDDAVRLASKGPWEKGQFYQSALRGTLAECEITPSGEVGIIAHVYRPNKSREMGEANAILMSRAYLMRDVRDQLIRVHTLFDQWQGFGKYTEELRILIARIEEGS